MFAVLRNGAIYFLTLLSINITQVVMSSGVDDNPKINSAGYLQYFTVPISSILISRFMMNLRQHDWSSDESTDFQFQSQTQSLQFMSGQTSNEDRCLESFSAVHEN
ncbi:hypothetical protein AcW1_000431 [Taiwanofungus camphoratus]|nr:hypothetical protein AcV7_000451 [Antrodia cinnamomea]KAI0963325.1 hypothetical protein AcW1_000431 [Antrodia cinnamomea]